MIAAPAGAELRPCAILVLLHHRADRPIGIHHLMGAAVPERRAHELMDADWTISPVVKQNKDRAWSQLGTSGSGNHFVEFGLFTAHSKINDLELGTYVALLSHSGSRGTGAAVCDYYSKIAFAQFPDLPSELKRLAWLSLDSQEGQEYWNAMELM